MPFPFSDTHKSKSFLSALCFILCSLLFVSCGFQAGGLPQATSGRILFSGQNRGIEIPVFINSTFESNLEKELTRSFRKTFLQQGWQLGRKTSDFKLLGRITTFSSRPTSLNLKGGATQYQITLSAEIRLQNTATQNEHFKKNLRGIADYIVLGKGTSETRQAKNRAIREASKKMAEQASALLQLAQDPTENINPK